MITCTAYRLEQLFSLGTFEPASVQREYQWTTRECGQLLADLFEAFAKGGFDPVSASDNTKPETTEGGSEDEETLQSEQAPTSPLIRAKALSSPVRARSWPKEYFLGPMVLLPAPRSPNKYFIYDGLQRFTTISILLSVMRDAFAGGSTEHWLELQQLLRTDDATALPRLKAPTPGASLATITGSLGGSRPPWRNNVVLSEADIRMRDAARLFHERTSDWSDERRRAFVSFVRNHTHVSATTVQDRSIAYKIFVTANDRGLSLQVGDIIKGRLVDLIAESRGSAAGEQISGKWAALQRSVRPHFDDLLRAVDFLEFRQYRPSTYGEALLDRFEDGGAAEAADWVTNELPLHRDRFATLLKHERLDPIEGPNIALRQLYFLDDRCWRAVAMALQWAYGAEPQTWARAIKKLASACYTYELLDWPAERRAINFGRAIEQIANGQDPFRLRVAGGEYGALHFSNNLKERARSALLTPITDESRRGAVVRWLETLYWPRSLPQRSTRYSSVEHVLPRAAKAPWTSLFSEAIRDTATNRLGNLCLVPQDINHELGNSDFATKRTAYLSLDECFKSAREVGQAEDWTPDVIERRTQAIALKASSALGLLPKERT